MIRYKWLLFDADNTLFDFDAAQDFSLTRTLMHYGLEPTAERKNRFKAINAALWASFDRGEISQEALVVERYARFLAQEGVEGNPAEWNDFGLHRLSESPVLLPGAEKLIYKLSDRYILCLVTNGVAFVQRRRLDNCPLGRFFGDRVYISGEMGCQKPEKRFFEKVLEDLGATKQKGKVLVIGDSLSSDIRGAFNAQLDSLWFDRTGSPPGPVKPTYRATSFSDMERILIPTPFWGLSPSKE